MDVSLLGSREQGASVSQTRLMLIGLLRERFSGLVDRIQVGEVQVVEQSVFTTGFNGHLCDSYSCVVFRLVGHVYRCVLQQKLLAYIPPHASQIILVNEYTRGRVGEYLNCLR